ncbi:TRAP transporter substrate-binding protein DctP [Desulfuromonas thiophila]|uniref:TRAP transporter substrate-binding protein DctP n=1 Tax=Desulfuromonas thiophila TaxID=57664 RepID=UPI0024A82442|nr:TRAP transporter substrate-binding protein DctP [Desulfuromonas thiophila]
MRKTLLWFGLTLMLLQPLAVLAATEIKIATVAPEGSDWMVRMRQSAERIAQRSQGRVNLKFYGGGVMGNEASVLRKMRVGQLQGGAFTSGGLARIHKDLQLYGLPLLARSAAEMACLRAVLDEELQQRLEQCGYIGFGFASGGFACLFSGQPIERVEQLAGLKLWVPEGDQISYAVLQALGLAPVTLPLSDVMTGLQTGLLDVVATSPLGALAFQWYSQVNCMTEMPLAYVYAALVIDKRTIERLTAEDRQLLRDELEAVYRAIDGQAVADNEAALQVLVQQGLQRVTPAAGELERWSAVATEVSDRLADNGQLSPELYCKARARLQQCRQQVPAQ